MADIPQEVRGMIDPVAAMTELKSRLSKEDWRTICDYIEAERELVKDVYEAAGKRAGMERAAEIAENHMSQCLEDKDIQKRWPDIKRRNAVYAQAIRSENDGHG